MYERRKSNPLMRPLIVYGKFPGRLLLLMFFLRFGDLFWVKSYFVPDEYWQSLEVAHSKVFNYSNSTLTWEWQQGIRSYLYPGIVAAFYWVLKALNLDTVETVVNGPRALQGALSALADVYFLRWVHERRNGQYSWAFISWATCYFVSYCSTRTLINTFEMNLTVIALYKYPWTPKTRSLPFISLVLLVSYIRPTAAVIWAPLVLINILSSPRPFHLILTAYAPMTLFIFGPLIALDSYFHGSLLLTPVNFFKFNLISNISAFYGTHDFLWYFYAGVPAVLGLQTVPFVIGVFSAIKSIQYYRSKLETQLAITIFWTLLVFSCIPHKEFRFLLPLVPMMIYISSSVMSRWSVKASYQVIYLIGVVLIVVHTGTLIFLGQLHQMGQLETMNWISSSAANETNMKVHFLAPCHSFPGYSHIHSNIPTRYITCEPNLTNETNYVPETDYFFSNTKSWLSNEYSSLRNCQLPSHIVTFDTLNITNFLHFRNYSLTEVVSHSEYFPAPKEGRFVHIYKRSGPRC